MTTPEIDAYQTGREFVADHGIEVAKAKLKRMRATGKYKTDENEAAFLRGIADAIGLSPISGR